MNVPDTLPYCRFFARFLAVAAACWPAAFTAAASEAEALEALRAELAASQETARELQASMADLAARIDRLESRRPAAASESAEAEVEALGERVAYVEEGLFDVQDAVGGGDRPLLKGFDAKGLSIGGFLTQQMTAVFGEDGDAFSFNATQLELLIRADVTDRISLFAAPGFLWETGPEAGVADPNSPDPRFGPHESKTPLILGDVTVTLSDALALQAGRMVTPHGIINIEHFPPVLLDPRQPMFLRPFAGETLFPNFVSGLQAKGSLAKGDALRLSYNLYAGSRTTGPGPSKSSEAVNAGGRLQVANSELGLTFGANLARGERADLDHYALYGFDLLYDKGLWLWKTEWFRSDEAGGAANREAFYTQPAFRLSDQWTAFYRFDYLDDGDRLWPRDNPGSVTEHTFGVNYQPVPITRFRLSATRREADPADSTTAQFSTTVSF